MRVVERLPPAPAARWSDAGPREHFVQFYDSDLAIADLLSQFAGDQLESGGVVIVIASAAHADEAERRLASRALDLTACRDSGRYVRLDAQATLDALLVEGWPDARRFADIIGSRVRAAIAKGRVAAFGEMVGVLCARGAHGAAIRLEELWNSLARDCTFKLCCAYPTSAMASGSAETMGRICSAHTLAIPSESYTALATQDERLAEISRLQQRALSLESEIAHRKSIESQLARRERELADFLDNGPQAMHSVGADGVIVWANAAELAMLGYRRDEYVGHHVGEFYVDAGACADILRRLGSGETLHDEPAKLRAKDGSVRDVRITSNVRWHDGAFVNTRCFSRDVSAQAVAEHALQESEMRAQHARALLASIVESSDDAIVSKSLDGRISSWNQGATRIFGYDPDEVIGRPITIIIPPELHQEEKQILSKLSRGERIEHFETVRVAKDGRRLDVSLTISPIRDADGRVVGISKVGRDVTDRKRLEETLREAERRKDEFIAMLGHELRNPLAPIRNVAEVLRRTTSGNADCERLCRMLERQVQQMTRLLDDLLDVGRITQGKIKFQHEAVDVASVVQRAVEASRPLIEGCRHELRVRMPKTPVRVDGDAARLVQLLTNLLNNAAKYTAVGGRIALRVVQRGDTVEIRVKDNGVGIAPDMLPRIFELFVQVDATSSPSHEGLGIGLTLVRIIAEHHGGSVEVHSAGPGRGSEFVVKLPTGVSRAEPAARVQTSLESAAIRKRIVIVDDNHDASQSLATLLRLSGHEVVIATDGASALDVVQKLRPDLALLDIGLPGMSGYEIARRLRRSGCNVRLAALTGYGAPEDRERSRDAGFDHHFVKPIDPIALEQLIASPPPST